MRARWKYPRPHGSRTILAASPRFCTLLPDHPHQLAGGFSTDVSLDFRCSSRPPMLWLVAIRFLPAGHPPGGEEPIYRYYTVAVHYRLCPQLVASPSRKTDLGEEAFVRYWENEEH